MDLPEISQQRPSNHTSTLYNNNIINNLPTSPLGRQTDDPAGPTISYNTTDYSLGTDYWVLQKSTKDGWPAAQHNDLARKALIAERDAQAKRKQMPPFLQKLSSFLDGNTRNTDVVRWSENGDSFIVMNEDEFAKALIPELFKHNNYASFVRQLNMYGFHKKVGLSDNSLRASERKNKNPSEYSNPYFKRGRPNLLWLIDKARTAPAKRRGLRTRRGDVDEGEAIDDEQLAYIHRELADVRRNQNKITEMLHTERKELQRIYGHEKAFLDLHEKHKTSINSILTFLAAVYNKQLKQRGLDSVGDDKDRQTMSQQLYLKQSVLIKDTSAGSPEHRVPKEYNQWPRRLYHSLTVQDRIPSACSSQSQKATDTSILQTTDGQSPSTPNQRQKIISNSPLTSYSSEMSMEEPDQIQTSLQGQQGCMAEVIAPLSPSDSIPGVIDQSYRYNAEFDFEYLLDSAGTNFHNGGSKATSPTNSETEV